MDRRKQIIYEWIESLYPTMAFKLDTASSDASFRRYFRLSFDDYANHGMENSYIVMDAPPENEEILTFCRIARHFHAVGLNVPKLMHTDEKRGFIIMTDLGCQHYLDSLNRNTADQLYTDALDSLIALQSATSDKPDFLPSYTADKLKQEMDLFCEWYLPVHLKLELTESEKTIIASAWEILIESSLDQPQYWVHRDYHSRNLMVTDAHNPGIIDFQDAVKGPITYDLVSLLKDCYIEWPEDQVQKWVLGYHDLAVKSGLLKEEDEALFLRWFHRMGIQRHLKVAGIFTRLAYRDGKTQYLNDLPLTLRYLMTALENDTELQPLYRLLKEKIPQ